MPAGFDLWLKIKNPAAPAVKREAEEEWGVKRKARRHAKECEGVLERPSGGIPMIDKTGQVASAAEAVGVFQKHCGTSDEHAIADLAIYFSPKL